MLKKFNQKVTHGKTTLEQFFKNDIDYPKVLKDYVTTTDQHSQSVQGLVRFSKEAREAQIKHNEEIKNMSFSAQAGQASLKALATLGNMAISYTLSQLASLLISCANASKRLQESALEAGRSFSSTKSDIEGYKTQINDLHNIINDSSSSYEESYNARQKLLAIQDEMIDKYGAEADAINLVKKAVNGQNDAFDSLIKTQWIETANAFKNGSGKNWTEKVGDAFANFTSGSQDNLERMAKEMEDTQVSFRLVPLDDGSGDYQDFSQKLEDIFGASITHTQHDDIVTLSGDLGSIYDRLLNIQSLASGMGIDKLLPDISQQADNVKNTLASYREIYSQYVLYEKILPEQKYETSFRKINNAYQKYRDAFTSGDENAIEQAKQAYAQIVQEATAGLEDQSVVDFFNTMYSGGNVFCQGPVFGSVPGGGVCFGSFIMPNTPGNPNAVISGLDPP